MHFALVQDGLPWPADDSLELIGRLPRSESLVLVGRNADDIKKVQDLRGKRIGIGPTGSGTEYVARLVLAQLTGLDIKASTHPLVEQLDMVASGELDLAAMVIDADAQMLAEAVRDRNLQIVDMPGAEAIANRLPFARTGRIEAGHYDPIRQLPSTDKRIIQIDTLVIGNGCARESATQGVITTLVYVYPDFVRVNRERPNLTGLHLASAATSYYNDGGPDQVGAYVPWFIDIMPTARWLQLAFALSLLFGAQAGLHRFRLWRIDAQRVHVEGEVSRLFAPGITVAEIAAMTPEDRFRDPVVAARIDALTARARRARGALPTAILVHDGPDGSGNGLPLSGVADCRPGARAQDFPSPARRVRIRATAMDTARPGSRSMEQGDRVTRRSRTRLACPLAGDAPAEQTWHTRRSADGRVAGAPQTAAHKGNGHANELACTRDRDRACRLCRDGCVRGRLGTKVHPRGNERGGSADEDRQAR